jgi:hydrogenase expression/formation protein HypC
MCLAIPAKILNKNGNYAQADFDGIQKKIIIALVPQVQEGQYVIVHAGMAIEIVKEEEAKKSIKLWQEMAKNDLVDKNNYV